ncbi:hypothetical protein [Bacillus paramobilis]|uniref:Uncharacterized protein n=1 Tax=Bacillus paramobilis TaxID=2817477 RepID=A0ABZ2VNQ3_9BACI
MQTTLDIFKTDLKKEWKSSIRDISKWPIYEEAIANADIEKIITYIENFFKYEDYLVIKFIINSKMVYFVHKDGLLLMTPEFYLKDETWEQIKELRADVARREEKQLQKRKQQV